METLNILLDNLVLYPLDLFITFINLQPLAWAADIRIAHVIMGLLIWKLWPRKRKKFSRR